MANFPKQNPFPPQGTFSINAEAVSEDLSTDKPPTLETDPIENAERLTRSYLSNYTRAKDNGRLIYIKGDHGSGKTHAINYIRDKVDSDQLASAAGTRKPIQLYAKVLTSRLMDTYIDLMADLSFNEVRSAAVAYLGVLATAEHIANIDEPEQSSISEALRDHPSVVYDALEEDIVGTVPVINRMLQEVHGINLPATKRDEILLVLKYLLKKDKSDTKDDQMARASFKWMTGAEMSDAEKKRLGIAGNLDDSEMARWCLIVLLHIFARTQTPIIIFIDQVERLVSRDIQTKDGADWLQFLADGVIKHNAFLVFSGTEESWQAQNKDLRGRVGNSAIDFSEVSFDEARSLVWIYLEAERTGFLSAATNKSNLDLEPFSTESVKLIVTRSGGNIRRFLQLAFQVFESAQLNSVFEINREFTESFLQKSKLHLVTNQDVRSALVQAFRHKGINFDEIGETDKSSTSLSLLSKDGRSKILIQINEAIFSNHEAKLAERQIEALKEGPSLVILIVLGYVSKEVVDILSSAPFHTVSVIRAATFDQDIDDLMPAIESALAIRQQPQPYSDYTERTMLAGDRIASIAETRQSEVVELASKLQVALDQINEIKSAKPEQTERQIYGWLVFVPNLPIVIFFFMAMSSVEIPRAVNSFLYIAFQALGVFWVVIIYLAFFGIIGSRSSKSIMVSRLERMYTSTLDVITGRYFPPKVLLRSSLLGGVLTGLLYYFWITVGEFYF